MAVAEPPWRPDLSGVWRRTATEGYEELVGALRGGYMMRKLAAKIHMVHTIVMTGGTSFRLLEVGGPIRTDQTLEIGGEAATVTIAGKAFVQKCFWAPDDVATLVVRRRYQDAYELDFARTLLEGGRALRIAYTHTALATGAATRASATFAKVGEVPATLAPPLLEPKRSRSEPPLLLSRLSSSVTDRESRAYFDTVAVADGELGFVRMPQLLRHVAQHERVEHLETIPVEIAVRDLTYWVRTSRGRRDGVVRSAGMLLGAARDLMLGWHHGNLSQDQHRHSPRRVAARSRVPPRDAAPQDEESAGQQDQERPPKEDEEEAPQVAPPTKEEAHNIDEIKLLDGITLTARAGEVTALMGPSGAGKSTLLNAMLARTTGRVEGRVTYDHHVATPRLVRPIAKFVPQEPVLRATSTCAETLRLACALSLPPTWTKRKIEAHVATLLDKFGLGEHRDVLVGDEAIKGLSGGQRKRLSIALELVTAPRALFLDEATSGLDARTASDVMRLLLGLAADRVNVVCTIHQPPASIFRAFDALVLLSRGRAAYVGPPDAAEQRFVDLLGPDRGRCPPGENVANHLLDVLVDDGRALCDAWARSDGGDKKPGARAGGPRDDDDEGRRSPSASHRTIGGAHDDDFTGHMRYAVSIPTSTSLLFKNAVDAVRKNPRDGPFRVKSTVFVAVVTALCFTGLRNRQQWAATRRSLIFIKLIYLFLGAVSQTAIILALEKAWLQHEFHNARFPFVSWFVARVATFLATQAVYSALYVVIVYWITGLETRLVWFARFVVIALLHGWASGLTGLLIGTFATNVQHANALLAPALLPNFLFSGFLFSRSQCPAYFLPLWYGSFFRYAMEAATYTQFKDGRFLNCGLGKLRDMKCFFGGGVVRHRMYLDALEIDETNLGFVTNITVLVGYILLMLLAVFVAMRRQLFSFSF